MNIIKNHIWDIHPEIADAVRSDHEKVGLNTHHDWVHAFRVSEVARKIALDEWSNSNGVSNIAYFASLSGLTHNADRVIQANENLGRQKPDPEQIVALVRDWLKKSMNNDTEIAIVTDAVLKHGEVNNADDCHVLVALKDADRVVNLDVDLFPRSGQFYADLPVVDYKHFPNSNPNANYRDPQSVLFDINCSLDWVDETSKVCVRTGLGRQMAEERAEMFYLFNERLKAQLEQEGILPYPFK